ARAGGVTSTSPSAVATSTFRIEPIAIPLCVTCGATGTGPPPAPALYPRRRRRFSADVHLPVHLRVEVAAVGEPPLLGEHVLEGSCLQAIGRAAERVVLGRDGVKGVVVEAPDHL